MTVTFLIAMAAPSQGAPSALVQLMPFALVLAIFYFIILMPMKRRQQKVATFLAGRSLNAWQAITTSNTLRTFQSALAPCAVQALLADWPWRTVGAALAWRSHLTSDAVDTFFPPLAR